MKCVKYIIYVHIECVVLNVAVGKRGVKTRKLFLNILLIMMIIITQNSKVYRVLCLEALLDDQAVPDWFNGSLVSQERGLGAEISYAVLQKEVTKRSLCQLGIQSSMNTTFCFCHCITVALALGRLRLMWLSHQALCGAPVLLLSFLIWSKDVLDCFSLRPFELSLLTQNFCVGLAYPGWFLFSFLEAESPLHPLLFFGLLAPPALLKLGHSVFNTSKGLNWLEGGSSLTYDQCIALASPVRSPTHGHLTSWHTLSKT